MTFARPEDSHAHSLTVLEQLYEYDDFMESIGYLVDLGCGAGLDLEWWATRNTRDEIPVPLNIRCTGVDILDNLSMAKKYPNIVYQKSDFEAAVRPPRDKSFDVLWCHDAFQYVINPLTTLAKWNEIASPGAMLALIVPQTVYLESRKLQVSQSSENFYHYTLVNLIHMLAVSGWDCRTGFFLQRPNDRWLYTITYKSEHAPMSPKTSWYELSDKNLLPESADKSIKQKGLLDQQDLILPWIDKSLTWYGK